MTKKEILWREILYQVIEKRKTEFTQKGLAQQFNFSLSTVFNALKIPRQTGAIRVSGRNFEVQDAEKFLYLWATHRNLNKEIIYQTNSPFSRKEAEGALPSSLVFACYSAYCKKYNDEPADYDKVFIYSDPKKLTEIKKRFPVKKGYLNFIVLKSDVYLHRFGEVAPDVQTFVDLWNLGDWYAKEFLTALKRKMFD